MAAQLDYNYATAKAVPGAKVDLSDDVVVTRRNEENDGVLKFGVAVAVGTTAGTTVKKVSATTDAIDGVALALPNTEQDTSGNVIVKKNASLSVITKGKVWGRLAADVTPTYGAKAYVVATGASAGCFTTESTGTIDINATFGNVADTTDGIAIIIL